MQDHIFAADNLGQSNWDSQANGTWGWTNSSAMNYTLMRRNGKAKTQGIDDSLLFYIFNDANPVVLDFTSSDGTGDARAFATACSVTGADVTATISNQTVQSFSLTLVAATTASPGVKTVTCYKGVIPYFLAIAVYSALTPEISSSALVYDAYIPFGAIRGAPLDVCLRGSTLYQLYYGGDNRGAGPPITQGNYRVLQQAILVPNANESATGAIAQGSDTGISKDYPEDAIINNNGSLLPDPTIPDSDPTGDCYRLNAKAQLNPSAVANKHSAVRIDSHKVFLELSGDAINPISQFSLLTPGITWDLFVDLEDVSFPDFLTYSVSGKHDCFPAHEVILRGQNIYSFPPVDSSALTIVSCLNGVNQINLNTSPITGRLQ